MIKKEEEECGMLCNCKKKEKKDNRTKETKSVAK